MKTLKDKFVSDNLWYLVLAYIHDTEFKVVEKWTKYNERGLPVFPQSITRNHRREY